MKNRLRTFIAVSLSSSVLAGIEKSVRTLQKKLPEVQWVDTKNLHVTLKFLGDVPLNDLPILIRTVTQSVETIDAFDITFQGLGVFPNSESPRTLWIGCLEGSEPLRDLAEKMNDGLLAIGFPKEARRFSPHITIGRIKKTAPTLPLAPLIAEQHNRLFGSCSVSEIQIFSSELTRNCPIYDELASIPLRY